jgi:hypothetical protein
MSDSVDFHSVILAKTIVVMPLFLLATVSHAGALTVKHPGRRSANGYIRRRERTLLVSWTYSTTVFFKTRRTARG